ncbi:DNA repair protein RAD51 homolog 4 isoform X1 [Tanacetum coccineum]
MGALKSLMDDYPLIDVIFLQFCASNYIYSVEDFLVHDVNMLVASAEKYINSDRLKQVCFQVASNVAMKLGGVVFLDSGNSFSPTRIMQIVTHISGIPENQVYGNLQQAMRNIDCHSVYDIYALLNVLRQLKLNLKSQTGYQVRLIIIDSISSLISPILGGSNAQGHALMVSIGYLLKELADKHNIAVVVTNHMVSGEGGTLKPALGESWKNVPHVRLQLSRDHASNFSILHVLRHPFMESGRSVKVMIP